MKRYFATVARGLEEIAARELTALGALQVEPEFTGVGFAGDQELLYRVNLWARIPFRVLAPLTTFDCPSADALYRAVRRFDWTEYLHPDRTLAVDCTGGNRQLNHTHFTALQVKNAIVDQQRAHFGRRSSIDVENPDLRVNVHIHKDRCVLSLDSSGSSLHRRGYRQAGGTAPLKETLAAALLDLAEWHPEIPLVDPLCGSGTIVLEAGLKALDIAPGLLRTQFPFHNWPDYDAALWQRLVDEARTRQHTALVAPICGSDRDLAAIGFARENAARCGLREHVQLKCVNLEDLTPPTAPGILLCNPPYGERIGDPAELGELYRLLGSVLKQRFQGWTAWVLSGNADLAQYIGLRASRRIPVFNGQIECRLLKYEIF